MKKNKKQLGKSTNKPVKRPQTPAKINANIESLKFELERQKHKLRLVNEEKINLYKELEETNKKLQKIDQLKSDFVSMVSHELRTPLANIKASVSLLRDGISGEVNETQRTHLTIASNNIDRLLRIINNLLDLSKIEAGKLELHKERVDLNFIIKQIAISFEPKIEEAHLKLKTHMPNTPTDVFADPDKMTQVITNLISNAVKFTHEGFVEISLREKGNQIECTVRDTGVGIAKEDMPKLFSKFEQFGKPKVTKEKGTGLGLSIAKGIVEEHKGKMFVKSELGKGTEFTFTLPKNTD
ncbi:MAG: HAMP domain-containing sensor histidine kinase [Pseudomonadota bacterium]